MVTTLAFSWLNTYFALNISALIVGLVCLSAAALALWRMKETFAKDLDYVNSD